jgi:hypothetical protein
MSFFSSLVANVQSGVANLGLSSRRFSLSRQDSNEGNVADFGAKAAATPSITVTSTGSSLSTQHGKRMGKCSFLEPTSILIPSLHYYCYFLSSLSSSTSLLPRFIIIISSSKSTRRQADKKNDNAEGDTERARDKI